MRSISESLSAGITGATMTVVGIPAADNCRSASSFAFADTMLDKILGLGGRYPADRIHLHRDLPECSTMVRSEDKFKAILPYMVKREVKIRFGKKDK